MTRFIFVSIISVVGMLYGFFVGASWNLKQTTRFDYWSESTLQWIGENSHYDVSSIKERPIIVLTDYDTLQYLWKMRTGRTDKVNAFYSLQVYGSVDDGTQRIVHKLYLLMNFDPTRIHSAKSGVHEMVHFVQRISGAMEKLRCPEESEREAYNLSADWMVQQGFTDMKFIAAYRAKGEQESECIK